MSEPTIPISTSSPSAGSVVAKMRTDLTASIRARDQVAIGALRTVLAAIANAEAPPIDVAPTETVGAMIEHARVDLTAGDVDAVIRHEIADRIDTIGQIEPHGQPDAIAELRHEIEVLQRYVDD